MLVQRNSLSQYIAHAKETIAFEKYH